MPLARRSLTTCIAALSLAIGLGLTATGPAEAGTCSREYIYAGSRLLAVVRPDPPATVPPPTVEFSQLVVRVAETAATASLRVRVATNDYCTTPAEIRVRFRTLDGSATAGLDYTAAAAGAEIVFPANVPSGFEQTISIGILDDLVDEVDEDLSVQLMSPTGAVLGAAATAVVTILDDEFDVRAYFAAHPSTVVAGDPVEQVFGIANLDATVTATPVEITYEIPNGLSALKWTCVGAWGGAVCPSDGVFLPPLLRTVATLPPQSGVGVRMTGTVAPEARGTLVATITAATNEHDPNQANNSAQDVRRILIPVDVAVTNSNGTDVVAAGQTLTSTVIVRNNGPNGVDEPMQVTGTASGDLEALSWTCVPTAGATCAPSGMAPVSDWVTLPSGSFVTYTQHGTVAATAVGPTVTTTVSAPTVPDGWKDISSGNNSATDADYVLCSTSTLLVPDGRLVRKAIAAGERQAFLAEVGPARSYSLELQSTTDGQPPGVLTVYRGRDGCEPAVTAVVTDTGNIEPKSPASRRVSFRTSDDDRYYRVELVNDGGSAVSYELSLQETSLFSAEWLAQGVYETHYSFANTTSATLRGTLSLFPSEQFESEEQEGAPHLEYVEVGPNRSLTLDTTTMRVPYGYGGTAVFSHDGPPGAFIVEAEVIDPGTAHVRRVRFQALRDKR